MCGLLRLLLRCSRSLGRGKRQRVGQDWQDEGERPANGFRSEGGFDRLPRGPAPNRASDVESDSASVVATISTSSHHGVSADFSTPIPMPSTVTSSPWARARALARRPSASLCTSVIKMTSALHRVTSPCSTISRAAAIALLMSVPPEHGIASAVSGRASPGLTTAVINHVVIERHQAERPSRGLGASQERRSSGGRPGVGGWPSMDVDLSRAMILTDHGRATRLR